MSASIFVSGDDSNPSTPLSKTPSKVSKKSMLIGSREEREQERKIMKRSSVVELRKGKNFLFPENCVIAEH